MSFLENYNSIIKNEKDFLKTLKEYLVQKKLFDISAKEIIVLDVVRGKKITVGEVKKHAHVISTNSTYTLKKLEKNGYIKKNSVTSDKRICIIELTEKAVSLLKDIYCKYKKIYN